MRFPTLTAFLTIMVFILAPFYVGVVSLYIFAVTQSLLGCIPTVIVTVYVIWIDFERAKAQRRRYAERKMWDVEKIVTKYLKLINKDESEKK